MPVELKMMKADGPPPARAPKWKTHLDKLRKIAGKGEWYVVARMPLGSGPSAATNLRRTYPDFEFATVRTDDGNSDLYASVKA